MIAACTDCVGYANANLAATALVSPEIMADPAIYSDAETMTRPFTPLPLSEEQNRDITRIWADIKAN